jgi:hypothetical protein
MNISSGDRGGGGGGGKGGRLGRGLGVKRGSLI